MKIRTKRSNAPLFLLMDALEGRRMFAFGLTTTATTYVVDTGGGVVFTILKNGATVSSTIHLGDMTSVKYNGTEMLASYAQSSRYSHYEQGLGSIATISATVDPSATPQWIKITCDDSAEASGGVIHYYVGKRGDPNIYMASLPTDVNNGPGEGRYIAYLDRTKFTPETPSDNTGSTGAIEGSDVFGHADGTTSSKFFNNGRRMIENTIHGVVGTGIGAFMTMGNREHSAGGPFFKDIDFQSSDTQIEMYNCVFTGHTQTEAYRHGLQGPYAMMFTSGATPALPSYSFLEGVGIQGLIPASQRGSISGVATGMVTGHETVVGLSNTTAQYWGYANATTGAYSITGIQPGTYTETLYDNELEVGTRTVTIALGANTTANIANTYYTPPAPIFRIGTWDGTPLGFLNSDKIETEHPSDVRMSDWNSTPNFIVGTNTDAQWPLAQFMGVNNAQRITFNLTAAQVQNMSLRIGITWGFSGARPRITANAGQTYAYTSAIPTASSDLNSRGITRGTWRGDNQLYTFSIPSSAFRAGTNTIDIPLVSGSYTAGQTWLSPNVAYDAIDLVPSTATAPAIASVTITPSGTTTGVNGTKTFTAVAKDANGNVITANIDWSAARGSIDANGNYVAPATTGSDTITATAYTTRTQGYNTTSSSTSAFTGTITGSGSTTISVLNATPTVVNAASASPSPVYGKTTTLSALGADLTGESNLTYTWSVLGTPPAAITFAASNGSNAGKSTLATFTQPGDYTFRVTITNGTGLSVTSDVAVTVFDKRIWYQANATSGTTLTDSSGSNNTASLSGSYAYATGVDGNAIKLTGGSASLPTGVVSTLNDFTIGAWVKPDASQNWARLFDFGTGTTAYMFFTPRTSTGVSRFAIRSTTVGEQTIDGPALAVGVWTHIAITLSGNLATLYRNGAR